MLNILITGGAGFIGSNFIPYFLNKYNNYNIINIDKLTYAGNLKNLSEVENHPRYKFIHGDILDKNLLESIFLDFNINGVIHFAAESHVDNSIINPEIFIKTNILGTFNLLEISKKFWIDKKKLNNRFHHISTDEVYGSLDIGNQLFTENSCYRPNSPYSASKAGADMLVRSYYKTYGLNIVITNSSNNYGPKQNKEKFIPTIIYNALNKNDIPVYGKGENIRDWIYVLNHCKAIDLVFHNGKNGETYNIGTKNEIKNIDLAYKICDILDKKVPLNNKSYKDLIKFVKDRPGHDFRYGIDPSKIIKELNFNIQENFDYNLELTVDWYLKNI